MCLYLFSSRCVPFRYRSDCSGKGDIRQLIEVLMITTQGGPGLLFPKVHTHTHTHTLSLSLSLSLSLNMNILFYIYLQTGVHKHTYIFILTEELFLLQCLMFFCRFYFTFLSLMGMFGCVIYRLHL